MTSCPSPEATTSAILGASSAGWSPSRPHRKDAGHQMEAGPDTPSDYGSEYTTSPNGSRRVPEHRANLGALRSHGLVSNSIFKSNASPTSSQYSPQSHFARQSPSTRQSPAYGFGLGISANGAGSPGKHQQSEGPLRTLSNSSMNSNQSLSDVDSEEKSAAFRAAQGSPRKSQGYKRLQKASYVSRSPFKKPGQEGDEFEQPLEMPNNAWAKSAAYNQHQMSGSPDRENHDPMDRRPSTPERTPQRVATMSSGEDVDMSTPTSAGTPKSTRHVYTDSPSGKGLLVNNRLHGPRQMSHGSGASTPIDSPARRERRKTVTFDEVLDVQEFDRESSFDRESLRSGSSESANSLHRENSNEDDEMWLRGSNRMDLGTQKLVDRLMVVNGSPDSGTSSAFSTPELGEQGKDSKNIRELEADTSNDSLEASSVDEPRSPGPDDTSLDRGDEKSFNTAYDSSHYQDSTYVDPESDLSGGNLSAYGALHRVESLVDELLGDEMLGNHVKEQNNMSPRAEDVHSSPPRRRRNFGPKLGEDGAKPLPVVPAQQESQSQTPSTSENLPLHLPAWSPLMKGIGSPEQGTVQRSPEQRHVSTVADQSKHTGRPHISRDAVLQRVAREKHMQETQRAKVPTKAEEPAEHKASDAITSSSAKPKAPEQMPVQSASKPVRQHADDQERSPLERLGDEVAAEQAQAALRSDISQRERESLDHVHSQQQTWFQDTSQDVTVDKDGTHLRVSNDDSSGRTSPSETSKPGLTPAQQAEQIIARRRSKNGKSPTMPQAPRRSLSEGDKDEEQHPRRMSPEEEDAQNEANAREEEILKRKHSLEASLRVAVDTGFESGLEREISRIYHQGDQKYRINDRGTYAGVSETVAHSPQAGDVEKGKAWRKLRRPSDMNEYAKEMREYRAKENPKKASGKVFVLVDSFTPTSLPVPSKPTRFYCVLDNGLHVVRTATAYLKNGVPSKIGQEFELIQHRNLEFSLTLVAQRDAHLQDPREQSPTSMKRDRMTPSFSRGVGKLFSSPKKRSVFSTSGSQMDNGPQVEPMLSYLNREGAFGQSNVVFDSISKEALCKCHVLELPVHGVSDPPASLSSATGGMPRSGSMEFSRNLDKVRGTLRVKVFYLPPLPGVAKNLLPDNLGDCIKGMEAARWHSGQPWKEGTLTQLGGDCQVRFEISHISGSSLTHTLCRAGVVVP